MQWTATYVFAGLFVFVTIMGFAAARWRAGDLNHINEWGLGGQRFGTIVTWFLLGGDLYTAYTFIAVPAAVFTAGALGFFAVPYTILVYPLVFMIFPRMWAVARKHGFVTASDFVKGRYGHSGLALAIALTGIIATMPYIALQLVGLETVIGALGFDTHGAAGHMPLIIAFLILAAFTYSSGLRAPAMIAIVKDLLIYVTVIAAIIIIPAQLGGWTAIFAAVPPERLILPTPPAGNLGTWSAYATLAFGSALALFLYPHSMTGVLSASSGKVIRRNAAILPAYSFVLALLALLGYMAYASGVATKPEFAEGFAKYGANFAVPALFLDQFQGWFVGIAFAAIGIGALVPAAIMSIAIANLYTRNIYKEYLRPDCTAADEARVAKLVSLIAKAGALVFVLALDTKLAIQLQLLGGIWIIQTLPAVFFGLYTRWLDPRALLIGWAIGIGSGTWMAYTLNFKGSVYPLELFGYTMPGYAAFYTVILNIIVSIVMTIVLRMIAKREHGDVTIASDYA
ncbi:MAG: monocarboxylate uptake permease MctP [Parvibaculaceae bacterium]